ncbi:RtcB family protein [Desulfuribacillus alkaliarsenatis]|uniref:RtcB family protein n=1 Tax=Desulfuribacillus alkaliarsenatis TaxID=766136 RepID=UPI00114C892B
MQVINGQYNIAKVFTSQLDEVTKAQVEELCNQEFFAESQISIMPDCHAGMGCVIGTTMTIKDKVVPNLVGVDIGCGLQVIKLAEISIDFAALDIFIRKQIPHGFAINQKAKADELVLIERLRCFTSFPKAAKEFNRAIGSLGGGNHFIEVNVDEHNNKYLVIHSGSRNLGHQIATYYQKKAFEYHKQIGNSHESSKTSKIPKELCYLEGDLMKDYLHDMSIAQQYASINRDTIGRRIVTEFLKLDYDQLTKFETIHNYIDREHNILRKGAISAQEGEQVIIPINMRDGSVIAIGKGNPDWNYSAPHGAGRIMSRAAAKQAINFEDFKNSMSGIWSTSIKTSTIDEAPMVYKPMEVILEDAKDTIEISHFIKSIYNFKSS